MGAAFLNAQQKNKDYPTSFFVPAKARIDLIKDCDPFPHVKICHNSERFWVLVKSVDGEKMTGRIDNDLVNEHPFEYDDIIEFEKCHIMDIF